MDAPHDLLESLLTASGPEPRSNAWAAFLSRYSAALLHAARSMGGDHDLVMDRYAFIVEALERDDFRRLRIYLTEGRGAFTTWLLVVARRLCLDHHRHRYGRLQSDGPAAIGRRTERKRLADLLGDELGFLTLPSGGDRPDELLARAELETALSEVLAQLEPADRVLLRLRFVEDLSAAEIARVLERTSPFVVYRRLGKLLETLRGALKRRGIEDGVA